MADCDAYSGWDTMSPDARLDALTDAINDTLTDMGYDPVSVSIDDGGMDPENLGETWMDDNGDVHVVLDTEMVESGSYDEAMGTAYHEAGHAQQYAEDLESGENYEYEQLWEDDADAFAEEMLAEDADECDPDPDSAIGGGDGENGGGELLDFSGTDPEFEMTVE
jgi:hypothetical protein